jgi:hypothetical protein
LYKGRSGGQLLGFTVLDKKLEDDLQDLLVLVDKLEGDLKDIPTTYLMRSWRTTSRITCT